MRAGSTDRDFEGEAMTRANVLLIYADHFPGPLMGIAGHERIPLRPH